jgi:hypothetical protein
MLFVAGVSVCSHPRDHLHQVCFQKAVAISNKNQVSIIKQEKGWDDYSIFETKAKASSATTSKAKRLSSEAEDNSITQGPATCQKGKGSKCR